jgi:hypothetical protein
MELHRADPTRRRQAIAVVLLTLLFGSVAMFALHRWFREIQSLYGHDTQSLEELLAFAFISSVSMSALLVLLFSVYVWRLGRVLAELTRSASVH